MKTPNEYNTYNEEFEQLIKIANDHQNRISYTIVIDILKEHNKDISSDDVQMMISKLAAENSIIIEPFDSSEDYGSGSTQMPEM